jgi:hypothetical protein
MAFHLTATETTAFLWTLILIGADTLAGIIAALAAGRFDLSEIARFLQTAVLPYVGSLLVLGILATANPGQFESAFVAASAAVDLKFLGDIAKKLGVYGVDVTAPAGTQTPTQAPTDKPQG